jgi:hypothetical protein
MNYWYIHVNDVPWWIREQMTYKAITRAVQGYLQENKRRIPTIYDEMKKAKNEIDIQSIQKNIEIAIWKIPRRLYDERRMNSK